VYQFLPYLEKAGFVCRIIPCESARSCWENLNDVKKSVFGRIASKIFMAAQVARVMFNAPRYDILFVQRVLVPVRVQKILAMLNRNVVFDFDDALFLNPDSRFVARLDSWIRMSRMVTLENDFTGGYASRFNSNILKVTGPIECNRYRPRESAGSAGRTVIGWIGSHGTARFVKPLEDTMRRLSARHKGLEIHLIGAPEGCLQVDGVAVKRWSLDTEVADLREFDIGIMPLSDDEWSKGKGGYKLLQYMSMGIAPVASAVGINNEIISDGLNGFLIKSDDEWYAKLSALIEDQDMRRSMGREARKTAVERYSYEAYTPVLAEKLERFA
jgi:glycosyltransferase involved in cell wall biosynthesis